MSELTRRLFLGSAALAAGASSGLANDDRKGQDRDGNAEAGARVDAQQELPNFRFALEASEGKMRGGSSAKEATVKQLPISVGIAGVSMWLEPGGMRELHWHATAAEWAFVIEGRCRTTVMDPQGNQETNDFEPGDIWYFPRGHGHSIQCLGNEPVHFILVFDNGYFSEFGTFSVTDWLGHVPRETLAKNLGLPESALAKFPKEEVYFAKGPIPPEEIPAPLSGHVRNPTLTHKFRMLEEAPHSLHTGGREWRVDASRFPISKTITGVILDLEPGGLRELHWHPSSDEWQYVISGDVRITLFGSNGRFKTDRFRRGDVGYVPMGYGHSIENLSDGDRARLLIAFNTGHYETIDLSQWLASNPKYLLAANFGVEESVIEKLPHRDVFIAPQDGPARHPGDAEPNRNPR